MRLVPATALLCSVGVVPETILCLMQLCGRRKARYCGRLHTLFMFLQSFDLHDSILMQCGHGA